MSSTKENIKIGDYIWIYTSIDKINKWEPIKIVGKVDFGKWKAINLYHSEKEIIFDVNSIHIKKTSITDKANHFITSFICFENYEFPKIITTLEHQKETLKSIKESVIIEFIKLCKPKFN